MARETRAATGNSKPRIFDEPVAVIPKKRAANPKANTTAKRAPKKAAAGSKPVGVTKKKATVGKKVEKKVEKASEKVEKEGEKLVEEKPKKVCLISLLLAVCCLGFADMALETRRRLQRVFATLIYTRIIGSRLFVKLLLTRLELWVLEGFIILIKFIGYRLISVLVLFGIWA